MASAISRKDTGGYQIVGRDGFFQSGMKKFSFA